MFIMCQFTKMFSFIFVCFIAYIAMVLRLFVHEYLKLISFFSTEDKNSTCQFRNPLFEANPSEHSWQSSLISQIKFFKFHVMIVPLVASWRLRDKDWGDVLRSETQTLRQASTFIDVILHCQTAIGDEIKRKTLVCVYII